MSSNIRLISRLDIKGPNLIKGIHLEGLRVLGDPNQYAKKYYNQNIDEILYIDSVASLYGRNNLSEILAKTSKDIFVPITAGGGLRSINDVKKILRYGADKVAINTAAVKDPSLITKVSSMFGSQCMVLSVQAKKVSTNQWEVYIEGGREKTGIDVIDWVKEGILLNAGEILLTSIDMEGTKSGFDLNLVEAVSSISPVPVIASGGMGNLNNAKDVIIESNADAIAIANVLHYNKYSVKEVRDYLLNNNINLREV